MATEEPQPKKRRLFLSLAKKNQEPLQKRTTGPRFDISSVDDLDTASKRFILKNTNISNKCAFRIFSHWVEHSKEVGHDSKNRRSVALQGCQIIHNDTIVVCLEEKQQNGTPEVCPPGFDQPSKLRVLSKY